MSDLNIVIEQRERVAVLVRDPEPEQKVAVYFETGDKVTFENGEAVEVWHAFNEDQ